MATHWPAVHAAPPPHWPQLLQPLGEVPQVWAPHSWLALMWLPRQLPDWQASPLVQPSPSSHPLPLAAAVPDGQVDLTPLQNVLTSQPPVPVWQSVPAGLTFPWPDEQLISTANALPAKAETSTASRSAAQCLAVNR